MATRFDSSQENDYNLKSCIIPLFDTMADTNPQTTGTPIDPNTQTTQDLQIQGTIDISLPPVSLESSSSVNNENTPLDIVQDNSAPETQDSSQDIVLPNIDLSSNETTENNNDQSASSEQTTVEAPIATSDQAPQDEVSTQVTQEVSTETLDSSNSTQESTDQIAVSVSSNQSQLESSDTQASETVTTENQESAVETAVDSDAVSSDTISASINNNAEATLEVSTENNQMILSADSNGSIGEQEQNNIVAQEQSNAQAGNTDPFEGLNIVFDKPQDNQTPSEQPTTENGTFVDPFLNPKTPTVDQTAVAAGIAATQATTQPAGETSLDALIAAETPIAQEPNNTQAQAQGNPDGSKKKKILMMASGVVGILLLAATSYFVFSTMFPTETNNLIKNLEADGSGTTVNNENGTNISNLEQPSTGDELPATDNKDEGTLPSTITEGFGSEDELPANATTSPDSTSDDEVLGGTGSGETTIEAETTKALATIEEQTSKAKQLLSLAKDKNDSTSIRSIAAIIRSLKAVKDKIDTKSYTSYSTEIEDELSKTSFSLDQITASLVTN